MLEAVGRDVVGGHPRRHRLGHHRVPDPELDDPV
jgi:hypothetical protein